MKLMFEVTGVNTNLGGPNNPPTYNVTLQAVPGEPMNREHFAGVPSMQISGGGLTKLLAGHGSKVVIDLTPVPQQAPPEPKPAQVQNVGRPTAEQGAPVVGRS